MVSELFKSNEYCLQQGKYISGKALASTASHLQMDDVVQSCIIFLLDLHLTWSQRNIHPEFCSLLEVTCSMRLYITGRLLGGEWKTKKP